MIQEIILILSKLASYIEKYKVHTYKFGKDNGAEYQVDFYINNSHVSFYYDVSSSNFIISLEYGCNKVVHIDNDSDKNEIVYLLNKLIASCDGYVKCTIYKIVDEISS